MSRIVSFSGTNGQVIPVSDGLQVTTANSVIQTLRPDGIAMPAEPLAEQLPYPNWVHKQYSRNDVGRAQRFVDEYEDQIRYVPELGEWFIWNGNHWLKDGDGRIQSRAVEHSTKLIGLGSWVNDPDKRECLVKEGLRLGNAKQIENMLKIACVDERIVCRQAKLDADPYLLGVGNGVVELRTGKFRKGKREDYVTKCAGVDYVDGATCPRWRQFIDEVTCGNSCLASYLQKWVGYTLTGETKEQCFAFLFGHGQNGKTIFVETIKSLLGAYAVSAPLSLIALSPNGREPTQDLAALVGARLVVGPELEQDMRLAESRVKDLTGGDTISARRLYQESFSFTPVAKLWLFGNHKPRIKGSDLGIWRRVRLIPFEASFSEAQRDPHLRETLRNELPGILLWALEGTRAWLAEGLQPPQVVLDAVAEYRTEEDTLGDFLAAEVEQAADQSVSFEEMYTRYAIWAERNGIRVSLSNIMLGKKLRERGFTTRRSSAGKLWCGIRLRNQTSSSGM